METIEETHSDGSQKSSDSQEEMDHNEKSTEIATKGQFRKFFDLVNSESAKVKTALVTIASLEGL